MQGEIKMIIWRRASWSWRIFAILGLMFVIAMIIISTPIPFMGHGPLSPWYPWGLYALDFLLIGIFVGSFVWMLRSYKGAILWIILWSLFLLGVLFTPFIMLWFFVFLQELKFGVALIFGSPVIISIIQIWVALKAYRLDTSNRSSMNWRFL
jgi:hypothetical protein